MGWGEERKIYDPHPCLLEFLHPCDSEFKGNRGHTERDASKSHRGKKTETGGSDPTFLRPSRPKVRWGRSRPPAQKALVSLFFPR